MQGNLEHDLELGAFLSMQLPYYTRGVPALKQLKG